MFMFHLVWIASCQIQTLGKIPPTYHASCFGNLDVSTEQIIVIKSDFELLNRPTKEMSPVAHLTRFNKI